MKGKVTEVFKSIQGEGIYLGERQLFVRLFGCNLACKFCDTKPDSFSEYEPEELLGKLRKHRDGCHAVTFTGGEPLLQKDFLQEMLILTRREGFKNYLETNGILYNELDQVIDYVDIVAMDIKLSTSTGLYSYWRQHRQFLEVASRKEVFLKIVVCHSTEEEDFRRALMLIKEVNRYAILILQPNTYEYGKPLHEKLVRFRNICTENEIVTCIIPQMHKVIGLN